MRGRSAWTFEIRTAPQRQQTLPKPPGSPARAQHATRSARFSIAHTVAIQHIGKETIVYGSTLAAPRLGDHPRCPCLLDCLACTPTGHLSRRHASSKPRTYWTSAGAASANACTATASNPPFAQLTALARPHTPAKAKTQPTKNPPQQAKTTKKPPRRPPHNKRTLVTP